MLEKRSSCRASATQSGRVLVDHDGGEGLVIAEPGIPLGPDAGAPGVLRADEHDIAHGRLGLGPR